MERRGIKENKESYHQEQGGMQYFPQCNSKPMIIINLYIKFETSIVFQHFHRLSDTSKATKERQEKIGQHKFGHGGYLNLAARIVTIEKPIMHQNNKLQIIFILLHCKR